MKNKAKLLLSIAIISLSACGASSVTAPVSYGDRMEKSKDDNLAYIGDEADLFTQVSYREKYKIQDMTSYDDEKAKNNVFIEESSSGTGRVLTKKTNTSSHRENNLDVQVRPVAVLRDADEIQSFELAEVQEQNNNQQYSDFNRQYSDIKSKEQEYFYKTSNVNSNNPNIQMLNSNESQPRATLVKNTEPNYSNGRYYNIQPGDTAYNISKRAGIELNEFLAANNLEFPYTLKLDQRVFIPSADTLALSQNEYQEVADQGNTGNYSGEYQVDENASNNYETASYEGETYRPIENENLNYTTNVSNRPINVSQNERRSGASQSVHMVQAGETLYRIAKNYMIKLDELARYNNISAPYSIMVGQKITIPTNNQNGNYQQVSSYVPDVPQYASNTNTYKPSPRQCYINQAGEKTCPREVADISVTKSNSELLDFDWPVRGRVISYFGTNASGSKNNGINIAVPTGTPVKAVADGKVIYAGDKIENYGKIILVDHDNDWVSAYAHNDTLLVEEGQQIQKGQIISKAGKTGPVQTPQLHFEIRKMTKPVDPLTMLKK